MQIVNHCYFKKLTVSLLWIIFHFHIYLDSCWHCASKKPNKTQNPIKPDKTQKNPPGLVFKKKTRGFSEPCARVPQWLEYLSAKHPSIVLIKIWNYLIHPMLLLTAVGTNDVIGTARLSTGVFGLQYRPYMAIPVFQKINTGITVLIPVLMLQVWPARDRH